MMPFEHLGEGLRISDELVLEELGLEVRLFARVGPGQGEGAWRCSASRAEPRWKSAEIRCQMFCLFHRK